MDHLVTGHSLLWLVLAYSVCPYAVLWVIVRCWPKGDDRRRQYLADYADVELWKRPFWVGDVAVMSLLDGLALRSHNRRSRRTVRLAASEPVRSKPGMFWLGKAGRGVGIPPFCMLFAVPYIVLANALGIRLSWLPDSDLVVWGAIFLAYGLGRAHIEGVYWVAYERRLWVRRRAIARLSKSGPSSDAD